MRNYALLFIYSGDYYFKRLCIKKDGKLMVLPTKAMTDAELLRDVSIKDWSGEVKDYIKVCNNGMLLESEEHVFLLQAYVFDVGDEEETRLLTVGVSYLVC